MSREVAFVLLTHDKPKQVLRLINTLNRVFDNPPIACHHDFTKCDLPPEAFAPNVSFVRPHLPTGWGRFSAVEAMLRALQLLYSSTDVPDWFLLLSGSDYPIKPAARVLDDLRASPYDVHIDNTKIIYNDYGSDERRPWRDLCHKRYCTLRFSVPFENSWAHVDPRLPELTRRVVTLRHPLLTKPFLPFSKQLACFAGEFWFSANARAANYLLKYHNSKPALASHYRRLEKYHFICPEESYCQTILCNAPSLKISQNNWRYIDWSAGGGHPKTLSLQDLPHILKSPAHLARKFDMSSDVEILNAIDACL